MSNHKEYIKLQSVCTLQNAELTIQSDTKLRAERASAFSAPGIIAPFFPAVSGLLPVWGSQHLFAALLGHSSEYGLAGFVDWRF